MKNNIKKGPAQDVKFDTKLYDFGRQAVNMSPEQRSEYRQGQKKVLETAGGMAIGGFTGKLLSKFAGIMSRNIGGGLHAVGQGLVRGFGSKSMKKAYDTFTNAPKQYGVFGKSANTKNIGNINYKSSITNPKSTQQYSLPKVTEGGVELGQGDLMRRGITPGPYGGYYKKTKAGKSLIHPWSM